MKRINFLFLALVAFCAVSCGGGGGSSKPEKITLNPKSTTVRGDLGDYFKVVEKSIVAKPNTEWNPDDLMFKIELEKIAELPYDKSVTHPVGTSGQGVDYNIGFGIKIFDKDGSIMLQVAPTASGFSGVYSSDDIKNLITMEVGETGIVRWTEDIEEAEQPNLSTFEISSAVQEHTSNKSSSSSRGYSNNDSSAYDDDDDDDDDYSKSSSSDSSKWNSIISNYDSAVDDYIKLMRKASNGEDITSEALSMLQKIESISEDLDNAEDELSPDQLTRVMGIASKVASAAMSF